MSGPFMHSDAASPSASAALARSITHRASLQTYHTIRWLVDPGRTEDAFRAYAYFRWVDDFIDTPTQGDGSVPRFLDRQRKLLSALLAGGSVPELDAPQERLLVDLIAGQRDHHAGLRSYLEQMMAVMEFDAGRRGRLISEGELGRYSQWLAKGVMDAIAYFIGHDRTYPQVPERLSAVLGAHVIHMLRDTSEDLHSGYFNIPRAVLEAEGLEVSDVHHPAYRRWIEARVNMARRYFAEGKAYLRRMGCLRAQIAGYLYCARFEAVLHQIERDGYALRDRFGRLPPEWTRADRVLPGKREPRREAGKTQAGRAD